MNLTMSMFATHEDYWKARSRLNESIVADVAKELGCERDNEAILVALADLKADAALGRAVRKIPDMAKLWHAEVRWYLHPGDGPCLPLGTGNTPEAALRAAGLMEGDE